MLDSLTQMVKVLDRKKLIKLIKNPLSALRLYKKLLKRRYRFIELIDVLFDNKEEMRKYIEEIQNNEIVNEINKKISAMNNAGNIPKNCMFNIYSIIRKLKPKIVVESGVAYGYSTTFILIALEKNNKGRLYSIDIKENSGELIPEELKIRWCFMTGESKQKLPHLLSDLSHLDIFIHDSLHTYENMMFEFNCVWNKIIEGGLLMSHDIDHNRAFFDFAEKIEQKPYYLEGWEQNYGFNLGILMRR